MTTRTSLPLPHLRVDDVIPPIMQLVGSKSKRGLLKMMLSCRAWFEMGLPILYKDLDLYSHPKLATFLIANFSIDPPPISTSRIKGRIGKLGCGPFLPASVVDSILLNNHRLVSLQLRMPSQEFDVEFWKALNESAPSTLRHLALEWNDLVPAKLPERNMPSNLASVTIYLYSSKEQTNDRAQQFIHSLSRLNGLQSWAIDSYLPISPSPFDSYPSLTRTCQIVTLSEVDALHVLQNHSVAFRPWALNIDFEHSSQVPSIDQWDKVQLPETLTSLILRAVDVKSCSAVLNVVNPLTLNTLMLSTAESFHEFFNGWPALVDKLKWVYLDADKVHDILVNYPDFKPSFLGIDGPKVPLKPDSSKWTKTWSLISQLDSVTHLCFDDNFKTSLLVSMKLPPNTRKISLTDPIFALPLKSGKHKFEKIRQALSNVRRGLKIEIREGNERRVTRGVVQERELWKGLKNVTWKRRE